MNPFMEFPMELPKRDFFIHRIISGVLLFEYKDMVLEIRTPDKITKYKASKIYSDYCESCKEEGLYGEKECVNKLIELGLWTEEEENIYKVELPDNIEKLKVAAYQNEGMPDRLSLVRESLEITRKELKRLQEKRGLLNTFSFENAASFIKKEYEIQHSTYLDGKKYDWSIGEPRDAVIHYYNNFITDSEMRELARTTPWTSFISANKYGNNIFGCSSTEMSDEQLMLLAWTAFYESIYSSMEKPPDSVINDDDMLDGWRILQNREQEHNEKKTRGEKLMTNSKIANHDEIFLVANNIRDKEDIDALNSVRAMQIKRNRIKQVREQKVVNHRNLNDVSQDIAMKNTQMLSQRMKNSRK